MEQWRLQCGPQSSSVEATSQLSWTVEAQAQLEAAAHLAKLLDSPAQVQVELHFGFGHFSFNQTHFFYSSLSSLCSEPVRLVGGASRCAGQLQLEQGEWRPVDGDYDYWTLNGQISNKNMMHGSL